MKGNQNKTAITNAELFEVIYSLDKQASALDNIAGALWAVAGNLKREACEYDNEKQLWCLATLLDSATAELKALSETISNKRKGLAHDK